MFLVDENSVMEESHKARKVEVPSRKININPKKGANQGLGCAGGVDRESIVQRPIYSSEQFDNSVIATREAATGNPGLLIKSAGKGDERSAIALFKIAENCTRQPQGLTENSIDINVEICKMLPDGYLKNPLALLQPAIDSGSAHARFVYASNSGRYLNRLMAARSGQSMDAAKEILLRSERYGREAAQGGVEEAFYFMARAYHTGMFGPRSSLLTYAYIIPILEAGSNPEISAFSRKIEAELQDNDIKKARELAFGCSRQGSALANPFNF